MGCGASSKRTNGKYNAPDLEASGYSEKTVSSPYSECNGNALEDEVKWLRLKLAQEKQEKEWMMPRGDRQASSSSSSKASKVKQDEEEIMWLRRMFDAEKSEKAWLMARIDSLDTQLKLRSDECTSLRAALGTRQAGRATPPPEQPSAVEVAMPTSKPQPSAVMQPSQPSQQVAPSADPTPLSPGTTMSLKERRGLKLGVDTGKSPLGGQSPVSPPGAVPASLPLTLPGGLEPARTTSDPVACGQSRQSRNFSSLYVEPMSPLLARRQTSKSGLRSPIASQAPLASQSMLGSSSPSAAARSMPLAVEAFKMPTLDEAPCSPKRKKRAATMGDEDDVPRRKSSMQTVPEDQLAQAEDICKDELANYKGVTMSMPNI